MPDRTQRQSTRKTHKPDSESPEVQRKDDSIFQVQEIFDNSLLVFSDEEGNEIEPYLIGKDGEKQRLDLVTHLRKYPHTIYHPVILKTIVHLIILICAQGNIRAATAKRIREQAEENLKKLFDAILEGVRDPKGGALENEEGWYLLIYHRLGYEIEPLRVVREEMRRRKIKASFNPSEEGFEWLPDVLNSAASILKEKGRRSTRKISQDKNTLLKIERFLRDTSRSIITGTQTQAFINDYFVWREKVGRETIRDIPSERKLNEAPKSSKLIFHERYLQKPIKLPSEIDSQEVDAFQKWMASVRALFCRWERRSRWRFFEPNRNEPLRNRELLDDDEKFLAKYFYDQLRILVSVMSDRNPELKAEFKELKGKMPPSLKRFFK